MPLDCADPIAPPRAPNAIDIHVGGRLRLLRKQRGWTQQNLADVLGLTFQQVQKYERGINRISASMMHRACLAMEVPVGTLFEGLPASPAAVSAETAEDRRLRELLLVQDVRWLLGQWDRLDEAAHAALLNLVACLAPAEAS